MIIKRISIMSSSISFDACHNRFCIISKDRWIEPVYLEFAIKVSNKEYDKQIFCWLITLVTRCLYLCVSWLMSNKIQVHVHKWIVLTLLKSIDWNYIFYVKCWLDCVVKANVFVFRLYVWSNFCLQWASISIWHLKDTHFYRIF